MSNTGSGHEWGRPAEGPWWRFVPRNRASGWLSLVAGVLLTVQSVYFLVTYELSFQTAVEVFAGLLGVLLIVRSVDGLRVLDREPRRP
ncbi:hypothetical protein [Streptomyces fuscigenes]|uniref:hypothetical protein n=1 Tax=Streptomyces fuscigenes TaxID=1528880 RepID=UPI001F345DB8|nr:hypothetical protein [Streptomyces fuscigenes]MCF3962629.1 hypothetical protein [Streptomyces fuscigenes]